MTALTAPHWADLVALHLLRGTPTKIGVLAERLGIHRSIIEHAIEAARKEGVPVCSSQEGVWLGESEAEIRATADALAQRLVTQYQTVRALRQTARRMRGAQQTTLPWQEVA